MKTATVDRSTSLTGRLNKWVLGVIAGVTATYLGAVVSGLAPKPENTKPVGQNEGGIAVASGAVTLDVRASFTKSETVFNKTRDIETGDEL